MLAAVIGGAVSSTAHAAGPSAQELGQRARALSVRSFKVSIDVGDVKDASSSDNIFVTVNHYRPFHLNHGIVDFKRDLTHTYDLPVGPFQTLGDIESLTLAKGGTDGVCIQSVKVTVDGILVGFRDFSKEKNKGGKNCHWLDNDPGYKNQITLKLNPSVEGNDLDDKVRYNEQVERGTREWVVSKQDFQLRLMSAIGHGLQVRGGKKVKWGYGGGSSKYVQADRASGNRDYNIDLDMKFGGSTKELDIDLAAQLCKGKSLVATQITNVSTKERSAIKRAVGNLIESLIGEIGEGAADGLAMLGVPKEYGEKLGNKIEALTKDYLIDTPERAEKRAGSRIQLSSINDMFPAEMCAPGAKRQIDGDGNITIRFK